MHEIKIDRSLSRLAMALAFGLLWLSASQAQLQPTTNVVVTDDLNSDGNINVNAARLRRPITDALGKAHIGIFVMHSFGGYQNFSVCNGLAQRGFTTLCADSIWTGRQDQFYGFEQHAPGIRAGINYLRNLPADPAAGLPAISKVILWGHSAGSAMMSFYQNVAENGPRIACQGRERILPCVDTNLRDLPKADGLMLFDPQEGPDVWFFNVDPAVINNSCTVRDPRVDMFLPENGLTGNESGTYSKQFLKRFFKEQAERNRDLLEVAQDLLRAKRLVTGNPHEMGDDIPFSAEWSTKAASLIVTDSSGSDLDLNRLAPEVRVYFFAGVQHAPVATPIQEAFCQQLSNPNPWRHNLRALFVALDEWATMGKRPPRSIYPRLSDGTRVRTPVTSASLGWPAIPGVTFTGFYNQRALEEKSILPPVPIPGTNYGMGLPKADADGNDIAGIRSPLVEVPVATYTGWAVRRAGFAEGEECDNRGQYIAFPATQADRLATGDPRLSIEERYRNHGQYVSRVARAADRLVRQRFLLEEDSQAFIKAAAESQIGK